MHKFLQYLVLIIFLAATNTIFGQPETEIIRVDYPKYIPTNTSFSVSSVVKFYEDSLKVHEIIFEKETFLKVTSAYINLGKEKKQIRIDRTDNKIILKIIPEKYELFLEKAYQLIFECKVLEPVKSNRDLIWKSRNSEQQVEKEVYTDNEDDNNSAEFYNALKISGNDVYFGNNSNFIIELNKDKEFESIYTEFWLKVNGSSTKILNISNQNTNEILLSISENNFGFLSVSPQYNEINSDEIFLGTGGWNYLGVLISEKFGTITLDLLINANHVYSFNLNEINSISQVSFIFGTPEDKNNFEIERLKIWEYNNSLELANREMHFLTYDADSSNLLYSTNFDEPNEFSEDIIHTDNLIVQTSNLTFVKSTAPIFSKAPKLNVTMGNSYNSIVWYVQEFSQAKEFVLEKAVKNGKYNEVYKVFADDDPLKIYYFTDEILNENEVAFYRVRQINKDGSEVTSAEVKIGNSGIAEFSLSQNYPNPFNPVTNIYVTVVVPAKFEVKVYDLVGNVVDHLFKGYLPQGLHTFEFDGSSLPSGIYFYEVLSPKAQVVKKMILAK